MADYEKAIELEPNDRQSYGHLSWLLATSPDSHYRDGERAVELAGKAVELSE